jgi:hypothetical protein
VIASAITVIAYAITANRTLRRSASRMRSACTSGSDEMISAG